MSKTRANNGMKENLSPTTESKNNLLIGQIYWKGCAYPVREIDTGKTFVQGVCGKPAG